MEPNPLSGYGDKLNNIRHTQGYYNNNSLISFSRSTPAKKLERLRRLFKNEFKDYYIFDKPLLDAGETNWLNCHDGRLNFVNKKHKELFYRELKKHTDGGPLYTRCVYLYRKSDNCLLYTWIDKDNSKQSHAEKKKIVNIFMQTLWKTIPKNLVVFPYLNKDFSEWPPREKHKYLIFLKTMTGHGGLRDFELCALREAEKRERSFREWLGEMKIIPKWLDKYGNPDKLAKINFVEKFFEKLDEKIINKIINMPHDPKNPARDVRYSFLCEYAYFITARNLINPLSWYVGLASMTKLAEEWNNIIRLVKGGSHEDFALALGQLIGAVLSIPVGIKAFKPLTPAALSALKQAAEKAKVPINKINDIIKKIDKKFDLPEKPKPKIITREEGLIKHRQKHVKKLQGRLKHAKKELKTPKKNPDNTSKILQKPLSRLKSRRFPPQKPNYEISYRAGKGHFDNYKKALALKKKHSNKKQINDQIRNQRKKAILHLEKSENLKPPADISFENNWRLCVLRTHSYNWEKAIYHFKQAVEKYRMRKFQFKIEKDMVLREYQNPLENVRLNLSKFHEELQSLRTKMDKIILNFEKNKSTLTAQKTEGKLSILEYEQRVKEIDFEIQKSIIKIEAEQKKIQRSISKFEKQEKVLEHQRNKKLAAIEKPVKYQLKTIYSAYKELKSSLKRYLRRFEKTEKESFDTIKKMEPYLKGLHTQIIKTESRLAGIQIMTRVVGKTKSLDKMYTTRYAELQALRGRYKSGNDKFIKLCSENAKAKTEIIRLKEAYRQVEIDLKVHMMMNDIDVIGI
ncbi:MAG: hypothetical protein ABIH00_10690 [Armatimonadota bacterium]